MREALHNIIRHAHASEVAMEICVSPDRLLIVIRDNGQGFNAAAGQTGNGLANLRDRMAAAGGQCDIQAKPEEGACISLSLPLPQTPPNL